MILPEKLRQIRDDSTQPDPQWVGGFNACFRELEPLIEALKYYADHGAIIAEIHHGEDRQIIATHSFINHVAMNALKKVGIE